MGLFDVFKDKDEDEDSGGMAEETPVLNLNQNQKKLLVLNLNQKKLLPQSLLRKQHHMNKLELQYKVSLA